MIKQYIKKLSFSRNKKDIFDIVQLESEFHIEKKTRLRCFWIGIPSHKYYFRSTGCHQTNKLYEQNKEID